MRTAAIALASLLFSAGILSVKLSIDHRQLAENRISPPVTTDSAYFEADSLRRFSLGFDNIIADFIWIRLLQDASTTPIRPGEVSWEFAQLNALTTLDRNFENAYPFGSAFLSVFRRDKEGAKRILQKWVDHSPISWKSHYMLAYHLYAEMGDFPHASEQMLRAAQMRGAPSWLNALGLRLLSERGSYLVALHIALGLYPSISDIEGKLRLSFRIRSLRYQIQKLGWTDALKNYRSKYSHEPPSLESLRPFREIPREIAEMEAETGSSEDLQAILSERFSFRYDSRTRTIQGDLRPEDKALETVGIYPQQSTRKK